MDLIGFSAIASAAQSFADPWIWAWLIGGVLIGFIFGATPGLTATAGVAIATPLTFGLSFETSMALLLGIYTAGYFAGSIPAILINTPGAPGNAATSLDGYAMARSGRADRALSLAIGASFIGGIISVAALTFAAPSLARFALQFTAVEYATLGLFGLVCIAAVSGESLAKGLAAAVIGMMIGLVGADPVSGANRLTFGIPDLLGGVSLIPALIAFFAVTEILAQAVQDGGHETNKIQQRFRILSLPGIYLRHGWLALKSGAIGTVIGILPGAGPTIAAWIGYGEASRSSRNREEMGKGADAGIIAPEVANNAVTGGALVPLLTLGIPGDTVTAVLIGALLIQGIEPGPFFIVTNTDMFALMLMLLIVANIIMLVVGLGARRILPAVLKVPMPILLPTIAVLCAAGGFAVSSSPFDVGLVAVFGLSAYVLSVFGIAMPPLVLGLVLGPIIETNLRNALTVHRMDVFVFLERPISAALLTVMVGIVVWIGAQNLLRRGGRHR